VHNGLVEGREEESLARSGSTTCRACFKAKRADQGCQEQEMVGSDDLNDTTIAQRFSVGVRETWALTATPDGNNQWWH
jgi:hypothetical protein